MGLAEQCSILHSDPQGAKLKAGDVTKILADINERKA
jgi:hypothetical protein